MITLNENQQLFFDEVNNKNTTFSKFVLRGYAGTGKTVTLSEVIKRSRHKNILVVAPTVKALSVLQSKLPDNVAGKTIDFSTVSKLIEVPYEQITVMDQVFKLNSEGIAQLEDLLTKLKVYDPSLITTRTLVKSDNKTETKYIIDEDKLKYVLNERFNNTQMELMKPVEPAFEYLELTDVIGKIGIYDVIMIDEMSMVSEDDIKRIVGAVDALQLQAMSLGLKTTQLIMSGDKGQLPPVEGQLNHYFAQDYPADAFVVDLTTILRSTDEIANVAKLIRDGVDIEAITQTVPNAQQVSLGVKAFCNRNQDLLKEIDIALAFTNADVSTFNSEIRKAKGFSGDGANVGEPLIALANSVPNDNGIVPFANGEEFTIIKKFEVEEAAEIVKQAFSKLAIGASKELRDEIKLYILGHLVELIEVVDSMGNTKKAFIPTNLTKQYGFDWKNMFEAFKNFAQLNNGQLPLLHVTYSYARTIHKSQGSEWRTVLMWLTSKNMWVIGKDNGLNKRKLPYTGYTRAQETCHLVYSKQ